MPCRSFCNLLPFPGADHVCLTMSSRDCCRRDYRRCCAREWTTKHGTQRGGRASERADGVSTGRARSMLGSAAPSRCRCCCGRRSSLRTQSHIAGGVLKAGPRGTCHSTTNASGGYRDTTCVTDRRGWVAGRCLWKEGLHLGRCRRWVWQGRRCRRSHDSSHCSWRRCSQGSDGRGGTRVGQKRVEPARVKRRGSRKRHRGGKAGGRWEGR